MESYNSSKNQEIKGKLVARDVIYNVSYLISELFKNPEYADELMGIFNKPDYESAVDYDPDIHVQYSDYLDGYVWVNKNSRKVSDSFDGEEDAYRDAVEEHNLDYDYHEAYEYWIVTEWLGRKLEQQGEMVADFMNMTIWGRGCTGQAIKLDWVISKICSDMRILEGQTNEWNV